MLTDRDIKILFDVDRYHVLNRPQIQRLHFPDDSTGRATRRRLAELVSSQLLNRQNLLYCHPQAGAPSAVFHPSKKGCELLADHFDDPRFLLTPTDGLLPHLLPHWIALSDTHIILDQAIGRQDQVQLDGWINEYDVVNKDEQAPEKRYRLYTMIRPNPKLACAPDAAFSLSARGQSRVYYVEQDRATSGVNQIASAKTQGYAAMFEQKLHRRHFPAATLDAFRVLLITPSAKRRDNLRRAISGKPGANLWWFAATDELSAESFLESAVWHVCSDEPAQSIVKKRAEA